MSDKIIEYLVKVVLVILFVIACLFMAKPVDARSKEPVLKPVEATAYYDHHGQGYGADGRKLVSGLTVAGRIEDLGKTCLVYDESYHLLYILEYRDTGYGQSSGRGRSRILKGRTEGTIENGSCIDIYFDTEAECEAWGRKKVYIQIVDAKG